MTIRSTDLEVRVRKSGDRYAWQIHFCGLHEPVRFSVAIFVTENDARIAGEKVLGKSIQKREKQRTRAEGVAARLE